MSEGFYRAFEDRHRGSRELIKLRLRVYLPFVEPLCSLYDDAKAVDLGCGRGEWVELLRALGFDAQGVDIDDAQLAACRELGLNVHTCGAVSFLKKLPGSSQVVVTGFHIAEHIPFPDLQVLVQEALRVLKPGGLLILETPNPENIVVGTTNFYVDPTHQRPIPPPLLSFFPEYYGFEKVKILRLQESVELSSGKALTLLDVLNGVSPDYAIVARKTGEAKILAATNPAFEAEHGLTLENLANRYDQQAESRSQQAEAVAQQSEAKVNQAEAKAQQAIVVMQELNTQVTQSQAEVQRLSQTLAAREQELSAQAAHAQKLQIELDAAELNARQSEVKAQQAEARSQQAEAGAQLAEEKMKQSEAKAQQAEASAKKAKASAQQVATWFLRKGLKPTRTDVVAAYRCLLGRESESESAILGHIQNKTVGKLITSFMNSEEFKIRMNQSASSQSGSNSFLSIVKRFASYPLTLLLSFVQNHPVLKAKMKKWIQHFPILEKLREKMALNRLLMAKQNHAATYPSSFSTDLSHLTPRASQIYADLKAAIEHQQKETG